MKDELSKGNNDQWQWHTWQGLPYLRCQLLKDFCHGFFTQHYAPQLPQDLIKVLNPEAQAYRVKQVHGNCVLLPSELSQEELSEADGILTEKPGQGVWVASADCTPALIGDLKTGQVAAVHAGWRGTAQKIIPQAITRLLFRGSYLEDLRIALGPAIAGEMYQVTEHVANQVGSTLLEPDENESIERRLEMLQDFPNSPILDDPKPGRKRLDVRRVNVLQLEQLGIKLEQISVAPHCTYQQPEHFFSYRRTKEKQVQWSGIVSQTKSGF